MVVSKMSFVMGDLHGLLTVCFSGLKEVLSAELQQGVDVEKLHLTFAFLLCLQTTGRFSLNLTFLSKSQIELGIQVVVAMSKIPNKRQLLRIFFFERSSIP